MPEQKPAASEQPTNVTLKVGGRGKTEDPRK
jgi:hypothetical protein